MIIIGLETSYKYPDFYIFIAVLYIYVHPIHLNQMIQQKSVKFEFS